MSLCNFRLSQYLLVAFVALSSCAIKDDLPYPPSEALITAFEVEGQCDKEGLVFSDAIIDNDNHTVDVYVDDRVDLSCLRIKRVEVNYSASIAVEGVNTYFPDKSFYAVGDACPTLDCTEDVTFLLTTYLTYRWTLRVHQVIKREVEVDNQVGNAVIDDVNRNVIIYVSPDQDLRTVKVRKLTLGGAHGKVDPDPTGQTLDFNLFPCTFQVTYAWTDTPVSWDVYVYNAEKGLETTADAFPHANKAYIYGNMQNGSIPVVEYREKGSTAWVSLTADKISFTTTSYEAVITSLVPGTDYEYQVITGGTSSGIRSFTTAPNLQMENPSFDDWHIIDNNGKELYNPWIKGGTAYWDTGNRGTNIVGPSITTKGTEGDRIYANLQSRHFPSKFAAGNIFIGTFLTIEHLNGILSFGRPFDSFPTMLQFDYTYNTSEITKGGKKWEDSYSRYISKATYEGLRGKPDSCCVYIALIGDKDEEEFQGVRYPFIVRTLPSELHLFDPNSENVIAYGQFTSGENQIDWKTQTISLIYHYKYRTPKYIVVVCSSSKYGDYFTGGETSLMKIDNLKLLYD